MNRLTYLYLDKIKKENKIKLKNLEFRVGGGYILLQCKGSKNYCMSGEYQVSPVDVAVCLTR